MLTRLRLRQMYFAKNIRQRNFAPCSHNAPPSSCHASKLKRAAGWIIDFSVNKRDNLSILLSQTSAQLSGQLLGPSLSQTNDQSLGLIFKPQGHKTYLSCLFVCLVPNRSIIQKTPSFWFHRPNLK